MGKKDFIMNNKPAGRITPDNSIVIDKITSLMTQGKAEKALDEIKKLDIDESNPDYYFIRGITGFALLSMGAQAEDEDKALEYAKEANECFREAYENGMDFPDIEDAIAFTDNLINGDFDAIDDMFGDEDEDDNPMQNLAQEVMFTMPLLHDLDAKEGKESIHNLTYWNNEEYYGFGLSAAGYIEQIRYTNTKSLTRYLQGNFKGTEEILSKQDIMDNELMLGFRKTKGVNIQEFEEKYNVKLEDAYPIKPLLKNGDLKQKGEYIFINPDKLYVMNEILLKMI